MFVDAMRFPNGVVGLIQPRQLSCVFNNSLRRLERISNRRLNIFTAYRFNRNFQLFGLRLKRRIG